MNNKVNKFLLSLVLLGCIASCNGSSDIGSENRNLSMNESVSTSIETTDDFILSSTFSKTFSPIDASLNECRLENFSGSSSGSVISPFGSSHAYASYTIDIPVSTYYMVEIRYRVSKLSSYSLFVNEVNKYPLNFKGDNSFKITKVMVKFNKGTNTLKIRNTQGQGYEGYIDTVKVSGFSSLASVALFIEDRDVYDYENKISFNLPLGYEVNIKTSSDPSVIDANGNILDFSNNKVVTLDLIVSRDQYTTTKSIKINVKKSSPSAEAIANEIFSEENNKVIPSAKTNIEFPSKYTDTKVYMTYSSDEVAISRNGVVVAKKDDYSVQVKYLVRKLDGSEAITNPITYVLKGLGFDYSTYFENPLGVGQDPYSTFLDGYYYHIRSVNFSTFSRLEMTRTTSLLDYKDSGFVTLYTFPANAWNSVELWGPFPLMKWNDGHYYIYYAADNGNNYNHRQGVIKSKTTDPMGEYEDLGMINTSDLENNPNPNLNNTRWAIGATTYKHTDGQWYLTWSGWKNINDGFPQRSYIAKIIEPNKIGARVELSIPTETWEGVNDDSPLQEGQAIFRINGTIFLLYSANASWAGRYSLGMLVFKNQYEGGLLNNRNWVKQKDPVFVTTECVESPGGPTIVQSPNGSEYWLMYHCSMWKGSGWTRVVCAKPIRLDSEGLPILDDPIPFYTLMRGPSGDQNNTLEWNMIEAEKMTRSNDIEVYLDNYSHGGEYVSGFSNENSSISYNYEAEQFGQYTLRICYKAKTEGTSHILRVNSKYYNIAYEYKGYNTYFMKEQIIVLNKGENEIELMYGAGYDIDIDFIGVKYNGEQ